jgi:hypothetical protein
LGAQVGNFDERLWGISASIISHEAMSSEFSTNIRRLSPGDEAIAEAACRTFGVEGQLATSRFLANTKDVLSVAEEAGRVIGWVYGHQLVHPDGEATMLLYALDVVA